MSNDVVAVEIRGIIPANSGSAVFIGNDDKVFVIQVEHHMGSTIGMFLNSTPKERPLTHDLFGHVFNGFGIRLLRVVITELKNSTYYARLILEQDNELGRKIIEVDARPSDSLAMAAQHKSTIYVASNLFKDAEDMSEILSRIQESSDHDMA